MVSQDEIHRMVKGKEWDERKEAAKLIGENFHLFPDINQAWDDLHKLTLDDDRDVRTSAADSLGIAFPNVPDKNKAWKDLHRLTKLKDVDVREYAALSIGKAFPNIPEKKQAWDDLHRLVYDEEPEVCESAAMSLNAAFFDIPDKEQAWDDLIWLAQYDDYDVLFKALDALGNAYEYIDDKEQAWGDIMMCFLFIDGFGQGAIVHALGKAFPYHPDKKKAWNYLHSLTQNSNKGIRESSMYPIATNFVCIPDKKQALDDINILLQDEESHIKLNAILALGEIIPHVSDKKRLLTALYNMTNNADSELRSASAYVLANNFTYIPDKEIAWVILIKLTQDNDSYVRGRAVSGIGLAFPYIPYKKQAWSILIRLAQDDESFVKSEATSLSYEKVRSLANHSLGRISIYKASLSTSETQFREELEKALDFFEKSSNEDTFSNPSEFCLPFYRSFYILTSGQKDAEVKVKKYLAEAKNKVYGSESKENLLEAVENLSNALKEVQEAGQMNLSSMKSDLNAFRRYCERVCELLDSTEEAAPGAVNLMRRGLPIIDGRIKKILAEIQEKSEELCKQTINTPYEELGKEVNKIGKDIIRDPISLEKQTINFEEVLSVICDKMSEEKGEACRLLEKVRGEQYIEDKLPLISLILSKIPMQLRMKDFEEKLDKMLISVQPTIQEKFEISTGIEIFGTGGKHIVTIPIQDISSPELKEQLKSLSKENKTKLDSLPAFLKEKIKEYLVKKDIL